MIPASSLPRLPAARPGFVWQFGWKTALTRHKALVSVLFLIGEFTRQLWERRYAFEHLEFIHLFLFRWVKKGEKKSGRKRGKTELKEKETRSPPWWIEQANQYGVVNNIK